MMRLAYRTRTALLIVAMLLPAALRAEDAPSVKEGFEEVGRAIANDSKTGWEATKDVSKKGWEATKDGVGTGLQKTGEGVDKAADGMQNAGEDMQK